MLYVKDIIDVCNGKIVCGNKKIRCDHFSNDSRVINSGDVYVGIKGDNFNGNLFYKDAIRNGAKVCILDDDTDVVVGDYTIILVNDTIKAIQQLAKHKRDLYDIPVIAITGSVGKTSVKDMICKVLSSKYKVLSTLGNKNNHIGLPLTILSLNKEDIMVLEMGMNHLGEIHTLSNIANPTLAIITNIGSAHIGNLGSRENILKAKLEILDGMFDNSLIINNDNDMLRTIKYNNLITIGIDNDSDYMASNITDLGFSSNFFINDNYIELSVGGNAFIYNALIAFAVGKKMGIDDKMIVKSLEEFKLSPHRLEIIKKENITIIDDTYNASLDSVENAIKLLGKVTGRKICVLGDILELGEYSKDIHHQVGKIINEQHIDIVITVGNDSKCINEELDDDILNYHYDNNQDVITKIKSLTLNNDVILVKGSHAMKMDQIIDYLKKEL